MWTRLRAKLASCFLILLSLTFPAHAAAPAPEAFGILPRFFDAALSPDGKQIATIIHNDAGYSVLIFEFSNPHGDPKIISLSEKLKPGFVRWVNSDRVIISIYQPETFQGTPLTFGYLYSLTPSKGKGKILIKPKGVFRQFNNVVVDWLDDDPQHILMAFSDDSNNDTPAIKRVNVETGRYKTVKGGMGNVQTWYTDTRGEPRIGQGRKDNSSGDWNLRIRDIDSNKWRDADDYPGLSHDVDVHGFTANHNEIIINDYRGKDTLGLYVYDLDKKAITRKIYHNEKYDASGVIMSQDGKTILGARYTADTPEVELLGPYRTGMQKMRERFPDFTVDYVDRAEDKDTLLFKVSGPSEPGAFMVLEDGATEPRRLGVLQKELPAEEMGMVIAVNYTSRDGVGIPGYVTLPPKVTSTAQIKKLPFIILPHGGPYGRDTKRFDYFSQFFATRGYGVLQMNFRGSDGYGKAYKEAGRKNWVIMQEDVEDGTRWLLGKGYADPERTCIAGWSYGGYAALMGAAKNSELYSCAIAMAALTDIKDFVRDLKKYRFGRAAAKKFIGEGFETKDDVKANSPVKIAEDMTVPLFLAHGTDDQAVHFDQYKRMKRALRKSKAKVTYMEFKDEDHYLSKQENRQKFFKGLDKFLRENNGVSEFAND